MMSRFILSAVLSSLMLAPVAASAQQVLTNMAPPAPIVENQPAAPGPNHTWVGGYWSWNGNQYGWTAGHWEPTPAAAQGWEAPQWEHEGQGYRFRPGRWRGRNNVPVNVQQGVVVGTPVGMGLPAAVAVPPPVQTVVTMAPPPPVNEAQPPSPGANYTWVAGYWSWNGNQYVWTAGRWEQPPTPTQTWQSPQWEREGQGYRFRPGRWFRRDGQNLPPVPVAVPVAPPPVVAQPTTVLVPVAPPRMRNERRPPRMQPGQTWVPGFWTWNGTQHVWTAGRWEAPPRPAARWMPGRWVRQGRGWQMQPGAWR